MSTSTQHLWQLRVPVQTFLSTHPLQCCLDHLDHMLYSSVSTWTVCYPNVSLTCTNRWLKGLYSFSCTIGSYLIPHIQLSLILTTYINNCACVSTTPSYSKNDHEARLWYAKSSKEMVSTVSQLFQRLTKLLCLFISSARINSNANILVLQHCTIIPAFVRKDDSIRIPFEILWLKPWGYHAHNPLS